MNCPLCIKKLAEMADSHFYLCDNCGAYVKDKKYYLDKIQQKNQYEEHNNDVEDVRYQKFTAPITTSILASFSKEHLGLDYGCGTGPVITKMLREKDYQVVLFDPYFQPCQSYLNHQYDYIFSCEVFEHFEEPKNEIEKLLMLLKPNGKLLIMTHLYHPDINFEHWYYRLDPTHVFIYTRKTIEFIANTFRLAIEKMTDRLIIFSKPPATEVKSEL